MSQEVSRDKLTLTATKVTGLILAGGKSTRMKQTDKFLLPLGGKRLIDHVIQTARPQVDQLLISANGDPNRLSCPDIPVVSDTVHDAGPLAGILAGLRWLQLNTPTHYLMTFAADTPLFPKHLVADMLKQVGSQLMVCACNQKQPEYTFSLWSPSSLSHVQQLFDSGVRSIKHCYDVLPSAQVHYDLSPPYFYNANTPEDLGELSSLLPTRF